MSDNDPFGPPPSAPEPPPGGWGPPTPGDAPPGQHSQTPGYGPPPQPGYGAPPPQYGYGAPPQGYGYPGYGAAQETESLAVVALVLSIVSWVVCPILPAIAALIVAGNADRSIRDSGGRKSGEGMVKAAKIISWIHLAVVGVGLVVAFLALVAVGVSTE